MKNKEIDCLKARIEELESIKMKLYSLGRINRSDVIDERIKQLQIQLKDKNNEKNS